MKTYFLWSLIGLSALLHGIVFYLLSGHSFFRFQGNVIPKRVEVNSVNLLPAFAKEEIKSQPIEKLSQELSQKNFVKSGQEALQKVLSLQHFRSSTETTSSLKHIGAQLFGTTNEGYRFIYLLDVSGSMREKVGPGSTRLSYAKAEIQHSLEGLPEVAEFNIMLFADRVETFSAQCMPATSEMKAQAIAFLEKDSLLGGVTDITGGLGIALSQWPDVIFLMTDGVSNLSEEAFRSQWQYLYQQSKSKSQISVIGFLLDARQEALLREITTFTQGKFWHWKEGL